MEHGDAVMGSVAAAVGAPGRFGMAGKSVLITGATGALGSAAARALAEAGALLTLAGGNACPLNELAADLRGAQPAALVTVLMRPDTPENAAAMVEAAVQAHGGLHCVLAAP